MTPALRNSIERIMVREGGFVDDPDDPGGATNMGITLNSYREVHPEADVAALKGISHEDAIAFYEHRLSPLATRLDGVKDRLMDAVLDAAVQHGNGAARRLLSRALGISATEDPFPLVPSADWNLAAAKVCGGRLYLMADWIQGVEARRKYGAGFMRRVASILT